MYETSKDGARVTPKPKVVVDPPPWVGRLNPPKGEFHVRLPLDAVLAWHRIGAKANRFIESSATGQVFLARGLRPLVPSTGLICPPAWAGMVEVVLAYDALTPIGAP